MTIYEAGAELFGWYAEHDCYNTKKDYNKLVLVSDTPDEDKAAIACALESFQETGIIKKKESEEGEFWVLNKKFSASTQSVEITSATAQKIHGLVNLFTETAGLGEKHACDPLDICERDIEILIASILILSKN